MEKMKMTSTERQAAIENFAAAVKREMNTTGMSRHQAVAAVAQKRPELHQQFLESTHKGYRSPVGK